MPSAGAKLAEVALDSCATILELAWATFRGGWCGPSDPTKPRVLGTPASHCAALTSRPALVWGGGQGWPVFLLNEQSIHTKNAAASPQASLYAQLPSKAGEGQPSAAMARVTIMGQVVSVTSVNSETPPPPPNAFFLIRSSRHHHAPL